MKPEMKGALGAVAGVFLVLLLGMLIFLYAGVYNVAATVPHSGVERWFFQTLQERSIKSRASGISVPLLEDTTMVANGFDSFRAMCVVCHGAPGEDPSEIGRGVTPTPPALHEAVSQWTDQELFWITRHGIRLAGMPAFGETHTDEQLWEIVAFMRRLPRISPDAYQRITDEAGPAEHEHEHDNGHEH